MFLYDAGVIFVMFLKTLVKYETEEKPSDSEISEIDICVEISNFSALKMRTRLV